MSEGMPERGVSDWTVPDWAQDTDDVEGGEQAAPPAAPPAAPTERAVAAEVRRRRRQLVLGSVVVVLAYVVFVAVLSVVSKAWPTVYAWVLLGVVLVLAVGSL